MRRKRSSATGYSVITDAAGFTIANEADNGDGKTLQSADGMARQDSWQINSSKPSRTFASYSDTRKDRITRAPWLSATMPSDTSGWRIRRRR
ncbi:hypothetical protein [Rhizobium tibeticum]|uniref:hypothetical protein n=1 Tax=Rhizobium tibeticum TaxID=501024 RepID=UPI000931A5A8|nr:hypothetical protein [Rhizobium tibeticum]